MEDISPSNVTSGWTQVVYFVRRKSGLGRFSKGYTVDAEEKFNI